MKIRLSGSLKMQTALIALYLFINGLFILKYSGRFSVCSPLLFLSLYLAVGIFIVLMNRTYSHLIPEKYIKTGYWILLFLITLLISGILIKTNPYSLQVDRWSAIHNFLQNLFKGVYPYTAKTHLGGYGSPFPVWQAFHIPFYLLGNVGIGMLFSILLSSVVLLRLFNSYRSSFSYLLLLFISPAFWYEVAAISDLFYNFVLCFITIAFIYKKKYRIQKQAIGLGIVCGLFLSTRLSVMIPFALFMFPDFLESDNKHKLEFFFSTLFMFILSFIPFILWNMNSLLFFKFNPFVLQTRQGSIAEIIVLAIIGIYLSFKWKNNFTKCSSYISIAIFILVGMTFLHRMISDNFVNGLFSSSYDITYFDMALPFLIFAITHSSENSEKI